MNIPVSCEFAHDDGAYVLGALSPADRLAFEQHLAGCPDCARAVREFAGLPSLLSRVDATVLEHPPVVDPVPETLLPALTHAVRRTQRRRVLVLAGVAAAALVAVVPLAISGVRGSDETPIAKSPPSGQAPTPGVSEAMVPVGGAPVRASLGLEPVAWGTRLNLVCTYMPGPDQYLLPPTMTYALVVRTRDGGTEQVGTWRSSEGRTMRLTAGTAASRNEISSVEVRAPNGRTVLKLAG